MHPSYQLNEFSVTTKQLLFSEYNPKTISNANFTLIKIISYGYGFHF